MPGAIIIKTDLQGGASLLRAGTGRFGGGLLPHDLCVARPLELDLAVAVVGLEIVRV